jgi:lipid A 4'-phosphatase
METKSAYFNNELFGSALIRSKASIVWGLGLTLIFAIVFFLFPEVDLKTSRFFYQTDESNFTASFHLAGNFALYIFFKSVDIISRVVLLCAIALTVFLIWKKSAKAIAAIVVTLSLIVGPLIFVNGILKEHWDRARPRELVEFGGTKRFTPAWVISDQCTRNCSFASGHAAAGFSFVVGHFVTRSFFWLWLGVAMGSLTGLTRIMVGAHFLSDVVFSFFSVFLASALVSYVVIRAVRSRKGSHA